jgi:hypothetical protein
MAREPHNVWLFGDTYTIHVTGKDTAGEYAVLEVSSPSGSGPPLHRHTREVEGLYIMNGRILLIALLIPVNSPMHPF